MECKNNTSNREAGTMQTVGTNFSLMTWNVLADSYINYSFYPYCPYPALKWPYRRKLILNAIQDKTPDIICMQELEDYDWFENNLESLGYRGLFKQRTRGRTDGCAIFYQDHKFKLVKTEAVELNRFAYNDPDMQKLNEFFLGYNRGQAADRTKKDCVALFAMLQPVTVPNSNTNVSSDESSRSDSDSSMPDVNTDVNTNSSNNQNNFYGALYGANKQTKEGLNNTNTNAMDPKRTEKSRSRASSVAEQICIATTHIYWNPKYVDVKMKQIKQVLLQLAKFNPSLQNTILCGDFNSTPTSGLYQFVRNGNIDLSLYTPDELDERATARNLLKQNAGVKIDQAEVNMQSGLKRKPSGEIEGQPRKRIHLLDSDEDDSADSQSSVNNSGSSGEESTNDAMVIRHPFKFRSAYEEYNAEELSEPYFTSYFKVFKGTVDYIFYTEDLARTHVVELPGPALLKQLGGVPHYQWPSDHLALSSYFTTQKPVVEKTDSSGSESSEDS
jgi:mRNA deadenylase 3'-5' endonuclease subunit Ccr4